MDLERFAASGYFVCRGLYPRESIAAIGAWLDAEMQRAGPSVGRYFERSGDAGPVLVRAENLLSAADASIRQIILQNDALQLVERCLGEAPVLFKDKVNFKPPGGRGDKLHQDQAAGWGRYADFFVTLCIIIDENTAANGA